VKPAVRIHRLLALALVLACAGTVVASVAQVPADDVFVLLRTIDDVAARQAWPGFRLSDWPLAVFDGAQTLLLRHPAPPPEFTPLGGHPGVLVVTGRHPAVASNSTVDLAGARTATVIATPGSNRESTLLAYVEEMFHVFWLRRHATFRPNEVARYTYPMKDARNLQRVLAEDEALARALEAQDGAQAAAWAATMAALRRERAPWLTPDDRAFETGLEMMEGTANAVARTVVGLESSETATRLRAERAADQLRWRYYDSGAAICLILDRLQPNWKTRIDNDTDLTTMALLEAAVSRAAAGARPAAFSTAETSAFERRAAAAIGELAARQSSVRAELLGRGGARIVVEIADARNPLRVTRFDPINLLVLDAGEVVHPRYLTLTGPVGTVEVTNAAFTRGAFTGVVALTGPAGRHPLADGVRTLTIVGLRTAPKVNRRDGQLVVEAEGVRLTLRGAEASTAGETVRIRTAAGVSSGVADAVTREM
jgi:hypothetical protein